MTTQLCEALRSGDDAALRKAMTCDAPCTAEGECSGILDAMCEGVAKRIKAREARGEVYPYSRPETEMFVLSAARFLNRAAHGTFDINNFDLAIYTVLRVCKVEISRFFACTIIETWAEMQHSQPAVYVYHAALVWLSRSAHPDLVLTPDAGHLVMRGLMRSANMVPDIKAWRKLWRAAMCSHFMEETVRGIMLSPDSWKEIQINLQGQRCEHRVMCAVETAMLSCTPVPEPVADLICDRLHHMGLEDAERLAAVAVKRGVCAVGVLRRRLDSANPTGNLHLLDAFNTTTHGQELMGCAGIHSFNALRWDIKIMLDSALMQDFMYSGDWWDSEKAECSLRII